MVKTSHAKRLGRKEADSIIASIAEARRLVVFRAVCREFKFHKDIAFLRDGSQSRCDVDDVTEEGRDLLFGREDGGFAVFRRGSRPSSALAIFQVCETDVAIFIMLKDKDILQKNEWVEWKGRTVKRRREPKEQSRKEDVGAYLFENIAAFRVSSKPEKQLQ